jgi:hypothetical protein
MYGRENPYPNRPHPVGVLNYKIGDECESDVAACKEYSMLEFGEPELVYELPRQVSNPVNPEPILIANLGHARGGSALLMAKCLKKFNIKGHIVSVDKFSDHSYEGNVKRLKELDVETFVTLYRGSTNKWAENFNKRGFKFDLIFVDADHTYEQVWNDVELWTPLLKSEGLMAFHDTNQEGVFDAVKDTVVHRGWKELEGLHVNRIRVFEKP